MGLKPRRIEGNGDFPFYADLSEVKKFFVDSLPTDVEIFGNATIADWWASLAGQARITEWVDQNPGTRPPAWWRLFAPRDGWRVFTDLDAGRRGEEVREAEAAFLHRHDLLTEAEAALWEAGELPEGDVAGKATLPPNRGKKQTFDR